MTAGGVQRLLLSGSRVLGGAAGLTRRISWATCLRSRPPAFEPHGGGEFVLAGAAALESLRQVDANLGLARILEGLAGAGAAALAIDGPVPADAVAAADALGLPLIQLPAGAAVQDAERAIIAFVLDRHNELQARASQLYRQLARISVEEQGLEAIIREAATLTGRAIAFEDAEFHVRLVAVPPGVPSPAAGAAGLSSVDERGRLTDMVRAHPVSSTTPLVVLESAVRWRCARYVAPVVTRERLRGYISLCGDAETLTEFDQLAASRAAAICTLELAKEDAVLAAERRVQGDLVDELLRPYLDPEATARRAVQAGFTPEGTFAVFTFAVDPPAAGSMARLEESRLRLVDALGRHLRRAPYPSLLRSDSSETLVLCQLPPESRLSSRLDGQTRVGPLSAGSGPAPGLTSSPGAGSRAGAEAGLEASGVAAGSTGATGGTGAAQPGAAVADAGGGGAALPAETDGPAADAVTRLLRSIGGELFGVAAGEVGADRLCAGASRAHSPLVGLPQAASEARESLRIGRRVYGAGRLVAFEALGLYRVLHALRDSVELRTFYEQTLGPLVEYDRRTGQNLVDTLEAFFASHGNLSETAKRLQLHRNSLLYRIGRVQEVGGINLEDPETRLSLQVALKARRLML